MDNSLVPRILGLLCSDGYFNPPPGSCLDEATHAVSKETLKGNPRGLTRNQHVVARGHLERFARDDRRVWAVFRRGGTPRPLYPKNKNFCAHRIWSEVAERGCSAIEKKFFRALRYAVKTGAVDDQKAISDYAALQFGRSFVNATPPQPVNLGGGPRAEYSQEAKDRLEASGLGFYSQHGDETRTVAAMILRREMDRFSSIYREKKRRWALVRTNEPVVLSDFWPSLDIPVSPNMFLHAYDEDEEADWRSGRADEYARQLRRLVMEHYRAFVVAESIEHLVDP